jgi:hypothetical protein
LNILIAPHQEMGLLDGMKFVRGNQARLAEIKRGAVNAYLCIRYEYGREEAPPWPQVFAACSRYDSEFKRWGMYVPAPQP